MNRGVSIMLTLKEIIINGSCFFEKKALWLLFHYAKTNVLNQQSVAKVCKYNLITVMVLSVLDKHQALKPVF